MHARKLQLKESKARLLSEETKKATNGAKQGLQVILDQNSNLDGIATHFDTDNSFKVYIGQPTAFPMLTRDPFTLPTGAVLCNWCSYIFIKSKRINRTIFQQIVANIDISSSYF